MEFREVAEWVLTLINGGESFSHPVTAAAELNPQAAVGGDDWLRQLITAETTWVTGEDTHTQNQDLIIRTPASFEMALHSSFTPERLLWGEERKWSGQFFLYSTKSMFPHEQAPGDSGKEDAPKS